MAINNSILVAVTELKQSVDADKPITERLKAAMAQARQHWLVTNEDDQFRAAIGAVLLSATDDEKARIESELKALRALSAATAGVPINFAALDTQKDPIGLLKIWKETA